MSVSVSALGPAADWLELHRGVWEPKFAAAGVSR
jgi:hypothetical protein